jgi:hypothetical protein
MEYLWMSIIRISSLQLVPGMTVLDFFRLQNAMSLMKLAAFISKLSTVQIGSCTLSDWSELCVGRTNADHHWRLSTGKCDFVTCISTEPCQVAPVVHFGGCTAICKASICTQLVFHHFEVLKLEPSMCQRTDPAFSPFLDSIGNDHEHNSVDLGHLTHTQSVTDLINFVFPPSIVADPIVCVVQAILSPFNMFVDKFNSTILNTVSGETHCYFSSDSVEDSKDGMDKGVFSGPRISQFSPGTWNTPSQIDSEGLGLFVNSLTTLMHLAVWKCLSARSSHIPRGMLCTSSFTGHYQPRLISSTPLLITRTTSSLPLQF